MNGKVGGFFQHLIFFHKWRVTGTHVFYRQQRIELNEIASDF